MQNVTSNFDVTELRQLSPNVWVDVIKEEETLKFFRVTRGVIREMVYTYDDILNFQKFGRCRALVQEGVPNGFSTGNRRVFYLPGDKANPRHGFTLSRSVLASLYYRITKP